MIRTDDRPIEHVDVESKSLYINREFILPRILVAVALLSGAFLRIWEINAMGYNTDEAVYAGQAAAIAGVPYLKDIFPVFRAHPLLFQFLLSLIYKIQFSDLAGRLLAVAFGMGTIYLTYLIGKTLYGRIAGSLAALFLALMPYHVIVSRQVLLDGPMVFFGTLTLYMLARFGRSQKAHWLYAAGAAMGLTFLSKETGIVLVGSIYIFLALASDLRVRIWNLVITASIMALIIAPFPITLALAGGSTTGQNYLVWQLFRRPNHEWQFYFTNLPSALGSWLIAAAIIGLIVLWKKNSWREKLVLSWIIVPFIFFQIWPVKGYQYLLPIAAPVALLAGRALGKFVANPQFRWLPPTIFEFKMIPVVSWLIIALISVTSGISSWQQIQPTVSTQFLAGTGGILGGREMGAWISNNVPINSTFMTLGPSMANLVEFYGKHFAYGLAVSPNPISRNPSYQPIINPDLQIRRSEIQYLVWDSYSANRSTFFSDKLNSYVAKYNGRAVYTISIPQTDALGNTVTKPVIIIYEVHP
jgi:4-amino-4-deoxy-L-arabinose transferase-like glycosyltransferase